MVKSLRHYIDIVESVIPNTLLNRVSPFTAQSKQNDDYLTRIKAQIENEESGLLTGFGKYAEYSNFNKNSSGTNTERNEFYFLNDKLRKYKEQAEKERRDAIIKNKQNRRAELIIRHTTWYPKTVKLNRKLTNLFFPVNTIETISESMTVKTM